MCFVDFRLYFLCVKRSTRRRTKQHVGTLPLTALGVTAGGGLQRHTLRIAQISLRTTWTIALVTLGIILRTAPTFCTLSISVSAARSHRQRPFLKASFRESAPVPADSCCRKREGNSPTRMRRRINRGCWQVLVHPIQGLLLLFLHQLLRPSFRPKRAPKFSESFPYHSSTESWPSSAERSFP